MRIQALPSVRQIGVCIDDGGTMPSPGGQCHQLKHQGTVYLCHCEERSDVAIRFLLGNMFEIGTLQGERIATPVCGLVRNDRKIGACFLKLMTLPPGGRYCAADIPTNSNLSDCQGKPTCIFFKSSPKGIPHLISYISHLLSPLSYISHLSPPLPQRRHS